MNRGMNLKRIPIQCIARHVIGGLGKQQILRRWLSRSPWELKKGGNIYHFLMDTPKTETLVWRIHCIDPRRRKAKCNCIMREIIRWSPIKKNLFFAPLFSKPFHITPGLSRSTRHWVRTVNLLLVLLSIYLQKWTRIKRFLRVEKVENFIYCWWIICHYFTCVYA